MVHSNWFKFTPAEKSGFFIACVEALCLFRLNINRRKTVK